VAYCPHCDGPLYKGKKVAVIGGGNSGVEAAIDLAGVVEHVTLIEFADQLKADAVLVRKLRSLPNVAIHTNAQTTESPVMARRSPGCAIAIGRPGRSGDRTGRSVRADRLGAQHRVVKGTVELSKYGEIVVDAKGATSVPGCSPQETRRRHRSSRSSLRRVTGEAALSAFDHLIRHSVTAEAPSEAMPLALAA